MTVYWIAEDYRYGMTHKRQRLSIYSGSFAGSYEGEAYSLPKGAGFMVTLTSRWPRIRMRVTCPAPRDDSNFAQVDQAINDALSVLDREVSR